MNALYKLRFRAPPIVAFSIFALMTLLMGRLGMTSAAQVGRVVGSKMSKQVIWEAALKAAAAILFAAWVFVTGGFVDAPEPTAATAATAGKAR